MKSFMGFKDNVTMINFFASTGKCNMKTLIDMLHIKFRDKAPNLPLLTYKFLSGPFKGSRFQSTAPNTNLMNRFPNFEVIFIDGPCAGLRTSSLITYDCKIEAGPTWQKLLSNARDTSLNRSVDGSAIQANKTSWKHTLTAYGMK